MAANDISVIIKERIKNYNKEVGSSNIGRVLTVADGIANVSGLRDTMLSELLLFPNNIFGMALNLEEDIIGTILFGDSNKVKEGDIVKRSNRIAEIVVGDQLLGRVVNPLGEILDGGKALMVKKSRPIEVIAPGIMTRLEVNRPLETGILAIDSIIPIGRGQRELIIGNRKTGKTAIAIDTIINQNNKGVYCVYVSIGQKNSTLALTTKKLLDHGAMNYTTIVSANASDSSAMQFIAPYAGMAIAEEWMNNGKDVLIVFDDLSKHAVAYRTVSLLLRRPPGREAYPGDVFYLHSKLLERSASLNKKYGGGSITALPIIETQAGDISAYIPTNVISITDGQIFLMENAFNSGQRPAIDAGLSVSRVGSAAQSKLIKKLSGSLKLKLANYEEIKSFSEFASDLDAETKLILENGKKIMEILKQPQYSPYPQSIQAVLLYLIYKDLIAYIGYEKIAKFKKELLNEISFASNFKKIITEFDDKKELLPATEKELDRLLRNFIKDFNK